MSIGAASSPPLAGVSSTACSSAGARRRRRRDVLVRLPGMSEAFLPAMRPGIVTGEPERHVLRLDGLLDDADELALHGVEVELVAQPAAEALQRERGVVAAAVEAAVDRGLDARPRGAEQRRDDQRGDGDAQ